MVLLVWTRKIGNRMGGRGALWFTFLEIKKTTGMWHACVLCWKCWTFERLAFGGTAVVIASKKSLTSDWDGFTIQIKRIRNWKTCYKRFYYNNKKEGPWRDGMGEMFLGHKGNVFISSEMAFTCFERYFDWFKMCIWRFVFCTTISPFTTQYIAFDWLSPKGSIWESWLTIIILSV